MGAAGQQGGVRENGVVNSNNAKVRGEGELVSES